MPSAIPDDAATRLPKARMIDPRGHRFGAGASAVLLIAAFLTGTSWLVAVVLASIGISDDLWVQALGTFVSVAVTTAALALMMRYTSKHSSVRASLPGALFIAVL